MDVTWVLSFRATYDDHMRCLLKKKIWETLKVLFLAIVPHLI